MNCTWGTSASDSERFDPVRGTYRSRFSRFCTEVFNQRLTYVRTFSPWASGDYISRRGLSRSFRRPLGSSLPPSLGWANRSKCGTISAGEATSRANLAGKRLHHCLTLADFSPRYGTRFSGPNATGPRIETRRQRAVYHNRRSTVGYVAGAPTSAILRSSTINSFARKQIGSTRGL
jgi:hypothetical protein